MKKFIDDKSSIVSDMLEGYCLSNPSVRLAGENKNILCRAKRKEHGKIPVIIGNGSGHEPAMIDLVGEGLFDANICGKIFTAPSPIEMMEGIREVANGMPVLMLVSSHTGDILNAKMTIMLAKSEGYDVRMVVLWDDVSTAPKGKESERRGTAGLFFSFKTVCAAAELGYGIDELIELAQKVRDNTRTLSVAVSGGTHPETGIATFTLPDDEIEIGMGVHGEAGSGRMKMPTAKGAVHYILDKLVEDKPFYDGDKVLVLINNSGATTRMELMILYKDTVEYLVQKGITPVRNWIGTYVTTQESAGVAISLCKADDELLNLYDSKAGGFIFGGRI